MTKQANDFHYHITNSSLNRFTFKLSKSYLFASFFLKVFFPSGYV